MSLAKLKLLPSESIGHMQRYPLLSPLFEFKSITFFFTYNKHQMSQGTSSQEVKKKKYKKVSKKEDPNESQSNIGLSIENKSIIVGSDISSIHSVNKSQTFLTDSKILGSSFVDVPQIDKNKEEKIENLHHDGNFIDLKEVCQDRQLIKQLKKHIKKAFPAKDIDIFSSVKSPTIKFQYLDSKKGDQMKIHSLGDLLKANKDVGKRQNETIMHIFDLLYCRIGQKQKKITKFLDALAEKRRIDLCIVDSQRKIPLLYYEYDQGRINFTLFDVQMKLFEFSSETVNEAKLDQDIMKIWSHFIKGIQSNREKNQKRYDEYGQFQVSSDQQDRKMLQKVDIRAIEKRLDGLIKTDLRDYEEQLQDMDDQCRQLQRKNDDRDKQTIENLGDQIFELHHNIDNFKQAIEYASSSLQRMKKTDPLKMTNLLKRLIIAQKQLKSRLPIVARKQDIFSLLNKQDLIILQGETGSGKSTQLPQMMYQYLRMFEEENSKCLPVLITQPRRLATRTVAERVASEMQEKIGGFVDYATSAHKAVSKTSKIIFKLDSVVLDQLTADRTLSNYSCLIIDQAHERTVSIDVILGLVKQLQQVRKGFKVIVTSASLDGKLFSEYFKVKVFKVSGRLFPVDVIYHPLNHEPDMVRKIQSVIKKQILLNNSQMFDQYRGDVLVFCSGVDDINNLCSIFQKYLNPKVFRVFALHGKIAVGEQKEVFYQTKEHKIIFASRIAETSITINGVKVVVDPGVDRELVYDQKYRVSSRKLINISQSSAKQRAGRAGRTSRGFCFRLYSQNQLKGFRVNKTPEIDNMALDTLVLRLKSLKVDNIYDFPYVKAPESSALKQSVETLQMIGGLTDQSDITTVGRLLLQLHVQPFLGRSIVQAIICDYIVKQTNFIEKQPYFKKWEKKQLDNLKNIKTFVIQILCMVMNASNLFFGNINLRERIQEIKYNKFSNQKGDFFFLSNIYSEFYYKLKGDRNQLNNWMNANYLSKKSLFQTKQLIEEITQIIKNFRLDTKDKAIVYLMDTIKLKLTYCKGIDDAILSCMVTSFCVNLSLYSENPKVGYTLVLQKKPISIYGSSTLSQQGLNPKWIVCYDLKTNDKGVTYCTIAHEVNFDFLKRTVQDFVFKKLNLKQAQHMNPFYSKIDQTLPSTVIAAIKDDYLNKDNNNTELLRHVTIDFSQESNVISIFYSTGLNASDVLKEEAEFFDCDYSIEDLVNAYVQQKIIRKKNQKFVCNVFSNIFAEFEDGFIVSKLRFTDVQFQFVVHGDKYVLNHLKDQLHEHNAYLFGEMLKIITYNQDDEKAVSKLLDDYDLKYERTKREKKEDTLMAIIYMRFYTGKLAGDPLFMLYGRDQGEICRQMLPILQQTQKSQKLQAAASKNRTSLKHLNVLCECKFKLSFNATGIKVYTNYVDAFELKEAFDYLVVTNILPFDFMKPKMIKQRRDEVAALAIRSSKEWQAEIMKVFTRYKLQGLKVEVKGERNHQKHKEGHQKNAQRLMKDELTAVITSKSLQTIDDMVAQLDGKEGLIGQGKIHFRYNFKQLIVKVNKRLFNFLQDEYKHIKSIHENTSNVKIQIFQRIFGKVKSVFVNCRSPIRQNLLEPTQELSQLFTPYIKRLSYAHFQFLFSTQQGEKAMEKLEDSFDSIYFGFIKKNHSLKIYCGENQFQEIDRRIEQIFLQNPVTMQVISYRGKGLVKVQEVLSKLVKENQLKLKQNPKSKLVLYYSINFKRREVQIYGDMNSVSKARNEVNKLGNSLQGSCALCGKNAEKPFRLTYCEHQFCEKCLADYVNDSKKEQNDKSQTTVSVSSGVSQAIPLVCPDDKCGRKISSADVQLFLSTEQFQALSMRRLKSYVQSHKEYFFCPTANCEQIFELKKVEVRTSFECVMCGRWFCSTCKQPHQYFTCGQWQTKLAKGELARFGYKKCVCGYIMQKENKGRLIKCRSCKVYMCWSCEGKSWPVQKQCMQHITMAHK